MSKKSSTFAPAFDRGQKLSEKNGLLDRFRLKRAFDLTFIVKKVCGNSSVGRAQPCQGWGREFESRFPLFFFALYECKPRWRNW